MRTSDAVASILTLPAAAWPSASEKLAETTSTCPPSRLVMRSPPLRKAAIFNVEMSTPDALRGRRILN